MYVALPPSVETLLTALVTIHKGSLYGGEVNYSFA